MPLLMLILGLGSFAAGMLIWSDGAVVPGDPRSRKESAGAGLAAGGLVLMAYGVLSLMADSP